MERDDVKLIHDILDGDENAFSVLVRKYHKSVHALAWRKIGDFHFAEEVAQDTFIQAYKKLSTLNNPKQFAGWLYVIADRCCQAWLRKKKIYTQSLETTDLETLEQNVYLDYICEQREEEAVEYRRKVVQKLLEKLPESERTVTVLFYLGEMSCEAISKFLGVSTNTVKSRLKRARDRLRQEESIIKETFRSVQFPPNFTDNIMQRIDQVKQMSPQASKPLPWLALASSALFTILLIGASNQLIKNSYQTYTLDSNSETTIEIVEKPVVFEIQSKPDTQNRVGNDTLPDPNKNTSQTQGMESIQNNLSQDPMQWNLPENAKTRFGKGRIREIAFSPDGSILAAAGDIGIWIYNTLTYKELAMFPTSTARFDSLHFIHDNLILATVGGKEILLQWDKNQEILNKAPIRKKTESTDNAFNQVIQTIETDDSRINIMNLDATIMPNKKTDRIDETEKENEPLLVNATSDSIQQLDINRLKQKNNLNLNHADFHSTVAFSHDQSLMANGTADYSILLWDTPTGEHKKTLIGHTSIIKGIDFSHDAKTLVSSADDGTIRFWEVETGTLKKTITDHAVRVVSVLFSPDGKTIAGTKRDGTIDLWNVATKEKKNTIKGLPDEFDHLVFNTKGQIIACGNGSLSIWDPDKLERKKILNEYNQRIYCLAIAQDGKTIATAHENSNIILWNSHTGKTKAILTEHNDIVYNVAFSPDSKILASASDDNTIRLWDVKTGREDKILNGHKNGVRSLAFGPEGKILTSGDHDKIIILWDIKDGSIIKKIYGHEYPVLCLSFSSDGELLASSDHGKNIYLWDPNSGALKRTLKGHTNSVRNITFSPDAKTLVSSSDDGTILIWSIKQ